MNKEELTKKFVEDAVTIVALGIVTEDTQEVFENGEYISKFKFSVPEKMMMNKSSLLERHQHLNINTTDGMMKAAKELTTDMTLLICRMDTESLFGSWSEDDEEEIKKTMKFYGKVRKDEVWTDEASKQAVSGFLKELHERQEYTEV